MMEKNRIIIGITHGDYNGIGYTVILKALSDPLILELFTPVIYGSSKAALYYRKSLELHNLSLHTVKNMEEIQPKKINFINCTDENFNIEPGRSTAEAGKAALTALEMATDDLNKGALDALVTAPINKKNIQSEAFHFPGHTEYLETHFSTGVPALMILLNDQLRIAVVTGHIPVKQVAEALTQTAILQKLHVYHDSLKTDFNIRKPRIAVLGLNPHAGDGGVIGNEEITEIIPAIEAAKKEGILCFGPYAADGFFGSGHYTNFDGILAMYHDQGLIPFKTLAMDLGVNYTAGLSIIRTSPAHGTAYDLAGKSDVSEASFRQALYVACDVYHNRKLNAEIAANPLQITIRNERTNKIE